MYKLCSVYHLIIVYRVFIFYYYLLLQCQLFIIFVLKFCRKKIAKNRRKSITIFVRWLKMYIWIFVRELQYFYLTFMEVLEKSKSKIYEWNVWDYGHIWSKGYKYFNSTKMFNNDIWQNNHWNIMAHISRTYFLMILRIAQLLTILSY